MPLLVSCSGSVCLAQAAAFGASSLRALWRCRTSAQASCTGWMFEETTHSGRLEWFRVGNGAVPRASLLAMRRFQICKRSPSAMVSGSSRGVLWILTLPVVSLTIKFASTMAAGRMSRMHFWR